LRPSFFLLLFSVFAAGQQPSSTSTGGLNVSQGAGPVTITVTDENNKPIEGAIITVNQNGAPIFRGATNYRGQAQFQRRPGIAPALDSSSLREK